MNTPARKSPLRIVLLAGFVAGTLDILAAFTQFYLKTGKDPLVILRYIASAAVGKEKAYGGGAEMYLLGLLFHYIIAYGLTIFFFWLYPYWNVLGRNRFITAVIYGIFAWMVTALVIVPLSFIGKFPSDPGQAAIAILILICMIGLPLSFIIGKYHDRNVHIDEVL
ncbi:hypothetical protein [Sediminibacterium soli]|uniref:hypothetical protein n=1 Tax=Sediminibacterium soli TaxID=2698829 RepID=UPI00137A9BB6|nr:hypothetical protein [Sediminibacterium soli]NCI45829.1 hypothetical protein [Sediminibacterium soli]